MTSAEQIEDRWLKEPDTASVKALEAGLARLRKEGWGRGKFYDQSTGKLDSLGALGAPFGFDKPEAVAYLAHAVRTRKGAGPHQHHDDQMCVITFNDGFRRKFADIEAIYLRAIRYASGDGTHVRT